MIIKLHTFFSFFSFLFCVSDNLTNSTFTQILPTFTNTSSMSINPHHSLTLRYSDNIFLEASANIWYTGVGGVVRQGLTHMAIPRGWTWGGPASEHCPVWCEIFTETVMQVVTDQPTANGICVGGSASSTPNGKCSFDI